MNRAEGKIDKGWGYEIHWANKDKYTGKILIFNNPGSKTSMYFHKEKDKSWFVNSGMFQLRYIDTKTAELKQLILKEGDTYNCPPLQPHQLISMGPEAMIIEVSTPDNSDDNYRVGPGDSQGKKVENGNENIPS
jgi:mannose-6-phosphate isomerase-like protein (cupin superfamily)